MNSVNAFKVSTGESRQERRLKMKAVISNVIDVKISGKDTGGKLSVLELTGSPGGPPLHFHPYQDEVVYVIQGEYLWKVGEEIFQLKSGDTIFLPMGVPHAFKQITQTGTMLLIYYPAGKMEKYFEIMDSWTTAPTETEIIQAFSDCDMKVVGAPL